MKQQIKVVMLPTEDYILKCVLKGNTHGRLVINMNRDLPQKFRETFTPQHLYITISQDIEPIKEGDWCIHLMQNVHDDMDTTHVFQAGVISGRLSMKLHYQIALEIGALYLIVAA